MLFEVETGKFSPTCTQESLFKGTDKTGWGGGGGGLLCQINFVIVNTV